MSQKISTSQAIILIIQLITPTAILVLPNIVAGYSEQDSWISVLLAMAFGLALALLFGSISRHTAGMPFIPWLETRFGRIAALVVGIVLFQYYLITLAEIFQEFANFLVDNILEDTPRFFLMMIALLVIVYAASHGIEVMARVGVFVFIIANLLFVISMCLQAGNLHFPYLLPIGEHSFKKLIQGSVSPISWLAMVQIILFLGPHLKQPSDARKVAVWGVVLSGAELLLTVIVSVAVFGPQLNQIYTYPSFSLIGIVKIGNFLERVDVIFISIWIFTMYVKMSLTMYALFQSFSHSFRNGSKHPFLIALGILCLLTSVSSFPKQSDLNYYFQVVDPLDALLVNVLLPLILWAFLLGTSKKIRKRGG